MTDKAIESWWIFFWKTIRWTAILMAVPACAQLLSGPPTGEGWTLWPTLEAITSSAGLSLPFASFAGGLAICERMNFFRMTTSALAISAGALLLLGGISPVLEYRADTELGLSVEERFPTGPHTLQGLFELRKRIASDPPDQFSFLIDRPLLLPPNWVTHLVHSQITLALFALFAVFLGALTASLTTGLSPPARKNARWAVGLVSGVFFFLAHVMGEAWVRADPQNSGILGAWVPMLVPALELGLLYSLLTRARLRATVFSRHSSDG